MNISDNNKKEIVSKPPTKDSNWGWFSVWSPKGGSNPHQSRPRNESLNSTKDSEFEVVQQELHSKSYTASHDHVLLEHNLQINDQYVNLNEYGSSLPLTKIEDDEKDQTLISDASEISLNKLKLADVHSIDGIEEDEEEEIAEDQQGPENENKNEIDNVKQIENDNVNETDKTAEDTNDAVMISQTLTLRSRNEELEKERDALHSEALQLRMQTECLKQTNQHIITAQQQEIQILQHENEKINASLHDKDAQLKQAQEEIARLQRERDNLKKKLHEICYNRLNMEGNKVQNVGNEQNVNVDISTSEVLVSNKHIIYGCIQCGQHLFDSSAMIQRQIEIDDNTFGCLVDCLFNAGDTTMGPTVCKTFLNGMFKVKEIFCDGCLGTFGWKIIESFDEWNTFHQNKYCIDISHIKQVSAPKR